MLFPIREKVCPAISRLNKKNLSLIDNLPDYRNTHGAINYSDCVLTESPGVLSLPVILLKTFDHSSEGVSPFDSSYVFGPSGQSSFYLHIDSYSTELSFPPLWSFFALAPVFSKSHKYRSQHPQASDKWPEKHHKDETTESLKGNKFNAIIPAAAWLPVLWTSEKNRGTSQQGGRGRTLDYSLILHPLHYPRLGGQGLAAPGD